jgi:hypothetical protein
MRDQYAAKYGFSKIPDWNVLTARVEMRKVKPLQLNHDPTLIVQPPAVCGWDEVAKVGGFNEFSSLNKSFSVLCKVPAANRWKRSYQSVLVRKRSVLWSGDYAREANCGIGSSARVL